MWLPVLFALSVSRCAGWHRWEYSAQWSDQSPEEALRAQEEWTKEWGGSSSSSGPRPRRGHSLVLFHSNNSYPYYGDSYIIMFGGRDNDDRATHEPKTYDLKKVNNKFTFDTYNSKPVNPCSDNGTYYSEAERAACNATVNDYSTIDVGVFYNDVWAYKLCKRCKSPHTHLQRTTHLPCPAVDLPTATSTPPASTAAGWCGTRARARAGASTS